MTTYVWKDDKGFVDKATGELMALPEKWTPTTPMIIPDITPHIGPGGVYVGSRSKQRELAITHGAVPYERVGDLANAPKGKYNPLCDKWKQWKKNVRDDVTKKAGLTPELLKAEAIALAQSPRKNKVA